MEITWEVSGWVWIRKHTRFALHPQISFMLVPPVLRTPATRRPCRGHPREVIDSIKEQDILATNPIQDADSGRTLGQRMADAMKLYAPVR